MRTVQRMLFGAMVFALPATLAAQKLTPGTWTGTIAPPDNAALDASFTVRMSGDTTKITLNADGHQVETTDVKVEATRPLFNFAPGGNTVRCTLLLRDDKSYSGDCVDDQGGKGTIVMKPPKM